MYLGGLMGAWNYTLIGDDEVQDEIALMEQTEDLPAFLESLRYMASKEVDHNKKNPDDPEELRIRCFVGVFYHMVVQDLISKNDIDELIIYDLEASFKELESNKIICLYKDKAEERFKEIQKAKKEINQKGFSFNIFKS